MELNKHRDCCDGSSHRQNWITIIGQSNWFTQGRGNVPNWQVHLLAARKGFPHPNPLREHTSVMLGLRCLTGCCPAGHCRPGRGCWQASRQAGKQQRRAHLHVERAAHSPRRHPHDSILQRISPTSRDWDWTGSRRCQTSQACTGRWTHWRTSTSRWRSRRDFPTPCHPCSSTDPPAQHAPLVPQTDTLRQHSAPLAVRRRHDELR